MEPQYKLIENTGCKEFDGNFLRDYRSFSNSARYRFTYTLTDLILKYQIKSVSKLQDIFKYSGYLKFKNFEIVESVIEFSKFIKERILTLIKPTGSKIN